MTKTAGFAKLLKIDVGQRNPVICDVICVQFADAFLALPRVARITSCMLRKYCFISWGVFVNPKYIKTQTVAFVIHFVVAAARNRATAVVNEMGLPAQLSKLKRNYFQSKYTSAAVKIKEKLFPVINLWPNFQS